MRGDDQRNSHLVSYLSPEQRVPADHPLRSIRTMTDDIARVFFEDIVEQARGHRLLSDEHFTVDGTLLEAWAGEKSGTPWNPAEPQVSVERAALLVRERH